MRQHRGSDVLIIAAISLALWAAGSTWLGAWSATMLAGGGFDGRWPDGFRALASYLAGRSPAEAWADPDVPPGAVVYPLTALWALALAAVLVVGARVLSPPMSGFSERRRLGADPEARFARPRELLTLRYRQPVPGRFILGRIGQVTLASVNPRCRDEGLTWEDRARRWLFARQRAEAFGAVAIIGLSQTGKSQHALTALRALSAAGCPITHQITAVDQRSSIQACRYRFVPHHQRPTTDPSLAPLNRYLALLVDTPNTTDQPIDPLTTATPPILDITHDGASDQDSAVA